MSNLLFIENFIVLLYSFFYKLNIILILLILLFTATAQKTYSCIKDNCTQKCKNLACLRYRYCVNKIKINAKYYVFFCLEYG